MLDRPDLPSPYHQGSAGEVAPRLLAIDGDTLQRMVICRVAARAGYQPAGAASYDEAAKLARQAAFDCITLDLSLGDHGGSDMLHHLAHAGCTAPILVVSGCDSKTCSKSVTLAKSLRLNVSYWLPKPVDLVLLRFWLEQIKTEQTVAVTAA
jgi:two-component system, chemotaxis family, chemotaxis protein CheY